jgi:hypothetical protein
MLECLLFVVDDPFLPPARAILHGSEDDLGDFEARITEPNIRDLAFDKLSFRHGIKKQVCGSKEW